MLALQVNLFIAVLKIKFAKAQTLFQSKLAKMSRKKRKNFLGRVMEKGKNHVRDQVKKRREASEVRMLCLPLAGSFFAQFPSYYILRKQHVYTWLAWQHLTVVVHSSFTVGRADM